MPPKVRDMIKLIEADGWYFVAQRGSHPGVPFLGVDFAVEELGPVGTVGVTRLSLTAMPARQPLSRRERQQTAILRPELFGEAAGCGRIRAQAVGDGGSGPMRPGSVAALRCCAVHQLGPGLRDSQLTCARFWAGAVLPGQSSDGLALPLYEGLPHPWDAIPPLRHATQHSMLSED